MLSSLGLYPLAATSYAGFNPGECAVSDSRVKELCQEFFMPYPVKGFAH